ncbi:hypothetical protein AB0425_31690 [Actinosynnema sp. NPDC051121]|nr:hypothetical protein [Saccharothrix sp.]
MRRTLASTLATVLVLALAGTSTAATVPTRPEPVHSTAGVTGTQARTVGLAAIATSGTHPPYTPLNPSYTVTEAGGTTTGQVNFLSTPWYYQWSMTISPEIRAGIIGLVTENTRLTCDGREIASSHHVQVSDYLFHGRAAVDSQCPQYRLDGRLEFDYRGAVGIIDFWDHFTVSLI